ncbi:DUF5060 domain-containing protein [Fontivita pretiosa]|uniref:DUF5060 domain-containing protein n=1 Tax=Fontivita pretiosa TaxID=2989684 RepID=UPI003D1862D0
MRLILLLLAVLSMLSVDARAQYPTATLLTTDALRTYERIEWELDLGKTYENPFDPNEIAVDATFVAPDGRQLKLPAFWDGEFASQPYNQSSEDKSTLQRSRWLLRFAAPWAGKWRMTVAARDRDGTRISEPIEFVVEPSDNPGFVRRAPDNTRYLQFDSGKPFFPIGLNIAWGPNGGNVKWYDEMFGQLRGGGGNAARIWKGHPNKMTETVEAGIGRFDLAAMEYYDALLESARRHGIYVMLCFNNHRDLLVRDQYGSAIWPMMPYAAENGGPATRPADFITSPACRDYYKRRLRYIIARYSAFTSVAFWEFFNEQEFTGVKVSTDWLREMADFMKAHDPYQHLVTESANLPDEQWQLASIDVTQAHLYVGGSTDVIGPIAASARRHEKFAKPHLVAELGIGGDATDDRYDPKGFGTILHNGIWASAMSGCAGSSWHWWWDSYVGPRNLWHTYAGLAKFAATIDWPRRNFRRIDLPPPISPVPGEQPYADLTLACSQGWGYRLEDNGDVIVGPNGTISQPLPHYLVSPTKPEIFRPIRLHVELPRATTMVLAVHEVSDVAVLRIGVDDKPLVDIPFSALPGAADVKRTRERRDEQTGLVRYSATLDAERTVEVPAGKHVITIANIAGDWVSLRSISFRQAQSPRHQLAALALQDPAGSETIAWIYDTRSHWKSDQDGIEPRLFEGATVELPAQSEHELTVEWWHTREGRIIQTTTVQPAQGVVKLTIPPFTRDIALRAYGRG